MLYYHIDSLPTNVAPSDALNGKDSFPTYKDSQILWNSDLNAVFGSIENISEI